MRKHIAEHNQKVLAKHTVGRDAVDEWDERGLPFSYCLKAVQNNFVPLVYFEWVGTQGANYVPPADTIYDKGWLYKVWTPELGTPAYNAMHIDGKKRYRINLQDRMWNYNWDKMRKND